MHRGTGNMIIIKNFIPQQKEIYSLEGITLDIVLMSRMVCVQQVKLIDTILHVYNEMAAKTTESKFLN